MSEMEEELKVISHSHCRRCHFGVYFPLSFSLFSFSSIHLSLDSRVPLSPPPITLLPPSFIFFLFTLTTYKILRFSIPRRPRDVIRFFRVPFFGHSLLILNNGWGEEDTLAYYSSPEHNETKPLTKQSHHTLHFCLETGSFSAWFQIINTFHFNLSDSLLFRIYSTLVFSGALLSVFRFLNFVFIFQH